MTHLPSPDCKAMGKKNSARRREAQRSVSRPLGGGGEARGREREKRVKVLGGNCHNLKSRANVCSKTEDLGGVARHDQQEFQHSAGSSKKRDLVLGKRNRWKLKNLERKDKIILSQR